MPGVSEATFRQLLHYLYTDRLPPLQLNSCVPLVELANRLCLTRLVQLVEHHMVTELQRIIESGGEVTMECLMLLEPCQVFKFHSAITRSSFTLPLPHRRPSNRFTTPISWQTGASRTCPPTTTRFAERHRNSSSRCIWTIRRI